MALKVKVSPGNDSTWKAVLPHLAGKLHFLPNPKNAEPLLKQGSTSEQNTPVQNRVPQAMMVSGDKIAADEHNVAESLTGAVLEDETILFQGISSKARVEPPASGLGDAGDENPSNNKSGILDMGQALLSIGSVSSDAECKPIKGNKTKKVSKSRYRTASHKKHTGYQKNEKKPDKPPLIVIDGPNVAKCHGKDKRYSSLGIKICANYYLEKGHDVICFIPQHYVKRKMEAPIQTDSLQFKNFLPAMDNIPLLMDLVDKNLVYFTPPQDYDDSYSIEYARKHDGYVITNDRFRDHIEKQPKDLRSSVQRWIREHCISFTFVRDEFLPNPDFEFKGWAS